MENRMTVHTEYELAEMRALCQECAERYRVINMSDYSGFEAVIEWTEKKTA